MPTNKITLLSLAGLLTLSACTPPQTDLTDHALASVRVNTSNIEAQSQSNKEAAEKIALAAEKMALNPGGFIYAGELIAKALTLDPKNTRALFYQSIINPFLAQRGIWARMAPWISKQSKEQQQDFYDTIREMPDSELKAFLLDGKGDIETAADWQNHLSVVRSSILKSRDTLQALKKEILHANFTIYNGGANASDKEVIQLCSPKKIADGIYEIPLCPYASTTSLSVARPDFEALSLSLSILATGYTSIFTAYSLEGAERVSKALEAEEQTNGYVDYQRGLAIVNSEQNFLKIRDPEALRDILTLGNEGMEALRYVLKHQPELCRKEVPHSKNRPGYLFSNGFCAQSEATHAVVTLHAFLNGPVQVVKEIKSSHSDDYGERYLTEINIENVLKNPIQDLRDLAPVSLHPVTGEVRFADESLGGLFPRNDASTFFSFGAKAESSRMRPVRDLQ